MALFKSLRGRRENIPTTKTDGYAYFCTDDATFWIDYKDENGNLQRKSINVESMTDAEIDEICGGSIPSASGVSF